MPHPLSQFRILIADADPQMSSALKGALARMGFSDVTVERSGERMVENAKSAPPDFIITEWDMDAVHSLRQSADNPALPIMMLTGRAEASDVLAARDSGINEYLVKPFSVKSIYDRLERLIEEPRPFVVGRNFTGPDRRTRPVPPAGKERREVHLIAQDKPQGRIELDAPQLWHPDRSLQAKLGEGISLASLIPPALLEEAQALLEQGTSDCLVWLRENLVELMWLTRAMEQGAHQEIMASELAEVALTVSARAGTFGYGSAAEVAYMLYLFCRNHLRPEETLHRVIVEKHVEVLYVIFATALPREALPQDAEIISELRNLTLKHAA